MVFRVTHWSIGMISWTTRSYIVHYIYSFIYSPHIQSFSAQNTTVAGSGVATKMSWRWFRGSPVRINKEVVSVTYVEWWPVAGAAMWMKEGWQTVLARSLYIHEYSISHSSWAKLTPLLCLRKNWYNSCILAWRWHSSEMHIFPVWEAIWVGSSDIYVLCSHASTHQQNQVKINCLCWGLTWGYTKYINPCVLILA